MDDMGSKIDDLEKSIAELCEEVGVKPDASLSNAGGNKAKPWEKEFCPLVEREREKERNRILNIGV